MGSRRTLSGFDSTSAGPLVGIKSIWTPAVCGERNGYYDLHTANSMARSGAACQAMDWGTWIRTTVNGSKDRCPAAERAPRAARDSPGGLPEYTRASGQVSKNAVAGSW